ncbi:transcriptional regulator, BadM/Rrf2 family [Thermaerobacter marianensis DSM 12885]|uniref:Transcriptional regulator, BadM/Rrf2 family n=1 Tax=Thermaerobacter marianensis (strain ATCC 700841 / DSM 12885 / JCM 10246 / 7p75a) TaxID=644966 RepID=E6SLB4_THEM7|nr:Rrf2 family transcriptional regulator [Thermaerobacter marianensis]ADU51345.1 transcriptional regulator, BadM/Rrf2 family [Thermaerobacter marianensis DSM 12885]
MQLSTRGRYGVRAMFELARRYGQGPVPLREVAEAQQLPENYLEQLMAPLRKGGLVQSVRGAQGGYVLARSPRQITVADIVRLLDGPIGPETDQEATGTPSVADPVWEAVRQAITDVLEGTTLDDLVRQAEERQRRGYMFYI